jgi:hypothetical protein
VLAESKYSTELYPSDQLHVLSEDRMKKNKFLTLLLPSILLFIGGCSSDSNSNSSLVTIKDSLTTSNTLLVKDSIDDGDGFKAFVNRFKNVALPFDLFIGYSGWIDFGALEKPDEIPRDVAIKYLCAGDAGKVREPDGGFIQYYYGFKVQIFDSLFGIIYYRTTSEYNGYVLTVFDSLGKLKDELFLAGTKGIFDPEAQKEGKIFLDGKIFVEEIIPDSGIDWNAPFKASIVQTFYQVSSNGEIKFNSTEKVNGQYVGIDQDLRYRFIKVDSISR